MDAMDNNMILHAQTGDAAVPTTGRDDRPRAEPTLDDLLRDPIVHLVMQRDGIDERTVRQIVKEAARKFHGQEMPQCAAA